MCVYLPIIWCTSFRHPRQENTLTRSEKALYVWWLFCAIRDIIVSKLVFFNVDINENGKFECGDFKWKMLLVSEWFRHTRKKELRVLPMVVKSTPLRLVFRILCYWALWHSWWAWPFKAMVTWFGVLHGWFIGTDISRYFLLRFSISI